MTTTAPLSARERGVVDAVPHRLYIGGRWREAGGGAVFGVDDPATGERLCDVADASPEDALDALAAAEAAGEAWAAAAPRERSEVLRRSFELLGERSEDIALLMTLEMGKPLAESRAEVAYAADFLRWFAEEAVRVGGDYRVSPNGRGRIVVLRQPVGPCLLITPWNFPLAMAARKLAPALAAGCTVVVKPAEATPLCTLALAKVLEEAGLPGGVLNVVTSSRAAEVSAPLIADPRLGKLSFTGSTEVGRALAAQAAGTLLRVSLELGGNAPFIVLEDADLDAAVEGALTAKLRNTGEACTAANRFLVARPLATEFARRLAGAIGARRLGRGTDSGVEIGPLIDAAQHAKVVELVDDALAGGARALCGGRSGGGTFYEPTVLVDVPAAARLLREEIFGPVAPVVAVDGEDDAVALANATEYGLVAYLYTRDIARALRVAERLRTGMVGLNQGMVSNAAAPFGGVKQSGYGREGGREGIAEYLDVKYLAVAL